MIDLSYTFCDLFALLFKVSYSSWKLFITFTVFICSRNQQVSLNTACHKSCALTQCKCDKLQGKNV